MHAILDALALAICQERCRGCKEELKVDLPAILAAPKRWKATNKATLCDSCFFKFEIQPSRLRIVNIKDMPPLLVSSRLPYEGAMKKILYHLKYDNDQLVVEDLSFFISQALSELGKVVSTKNCVLVPVPLHWKRMAKRGFNQAELLANRISLQHNIRTEPRMLLRQRPTSTQHQLGRKERLRNVEGAFKARSKYAEGAHVVLVDDLLTSGATLAACAATLTQAGALSVNAITLAYATATKGGDGD